MISGAPGKSSRSQEAAVFVSCPAAAAVCCNFWRLFQVWGIRDETNALPADGDQPLQPAAISLCRCSFLGCVFQASAPREGFLSLVTDLWILCRFLSAAPESSLLAALPDAGIWGWVWGSSPQRSTVFSASSVPARGSAHRCCCSWAGVIQGPGGCAA